MAVERKGRIAEVASPPDPSPPALQLVDKIPQSSPLERKGGKRKQLGPLPAPDGYDLQDYGEDVPGVLTAFLIYYLLKSWYPLLHAFLFRI